MDPRGFLREESWVGPLWREMGSSGPPDTPSTAPASLPVHPSPFFLTTLEGFPEARLCPAPYPAVDARTWTS